jgi:hypothetical protein
MADKCYRSSGHEYYYKGGKVIGDNKRPEGTDPNLQCIAPPPPKKIVAKVPKGKITCTKDEKGKETYYRDGAGIYGKEVGLLRKFATSCKKVKAPIFALKGPATAALGGGYKSPPKKKASPKKSPPKNAPPTRGPNPAKTHCMKTRGCVKFNL